MKKHFYKIVSIIMILTLFIFSAIPFASAATLLNETQKVSFSLNCSKPGYTFEVFKVASLDSTNTTPYETKYNAIVPEIETAVKAGKW